MAMSVAGDVIALDFAHWHGKLITLEWGRTKSCHNRTAVHNSNTLQKCGNKSGMLVVLKRSD